MAALICVFVWVLCCLFVCCVCCVCLQKYNSLDLIVALGRHLLKLSKKECPLLFVCLFVWCAVCLLHLFVKMHQPGANCSTGRASIAIKQERMVERADQTIHSSSYRIMPRKGSFDAEAGKTFIKSCAAWTHFTV